MSETFYKRISVRVNSTYNFNKYIHVGENLMIAKWDNRGADTNGDRGIPYSAMRQHPAIPVFSAPSVYADPVAMLGSDIDNPVQTLYNMRDNQNSSWRIFGNGYIEVIPITGPTRPTISSTSPHSTTSPSWLARKPSSMCLRILLPHARTMLSRMPTTCRLARARAR